MVGIWGCGCGGGQQEEEGVVTVLQRDGSVLELPDRIMCSKFLASHPQHMVCLARVMLGKEEGKMLTKDAMLERGQIYALVPTSSRSRMEFKISKEYRAVICGEDGANRAPVRDSAAVKRGGARVHAQTWSAQLDSISESDD